MSYTLTPQTMLEFDFAGPIQGEVHGIGFDEDTVVGSAASLRLYGTQATELHDYGDYAASAPGTKHYAIPVGQYMTGAASYLFFANDHDNGGRNGESYFTNMRILEG